MRRIQTIYGELYERTQGTEIVRRLTEVIALIAWL